MSEVIDAIRQSNNDVGGRILEFSGREYYVRGRGYIKDLASIEKIAVRASGSSGTPLLIKDLATVRFGPDIRRGLLEWNGEGEAVGGIVVMRYGENALDVIERVKKKFAELKPSFPAGVEMTIAYDRSGLIERSIDTLKHALLEEAIVVSLVIMLFLLHLRSSAAADPVAADQRRPVVHPDVPARHPLDDHEPRRHRHRDRRHRRRRDRDDRGVAQEARARGARAPIATSCWPRRPRGDARHLLLAADHRGGVPAGVHASPDRPGGCSSRSPTPRRS